MVRVRATVTTTEMRASQKHAAASRRRIDQ
jgi:hypothetical protein